MLSGHELQQTYDGTNILHDVSIAVNAGDVTVLLGQSGSGKTTLLRTLSLVDPPRSGVVTLDERRLFPISPNAAARSKNRPIWPDVSVVFQQFFLWPHFTLGRNITLPAKLRGDSLQHSQLICDGLGITDLLDRYPNEVSTGQRQRAALARALMLRPRYLLLDEVTSAQDVQHVAMIARVLETAVQQGMGLLVVSHHLGFARRILAIASSPNLVFLEAGRVTESGGPEKLERPSSNGLRTYVELSRQLG